MVHIEKLLLSSIIAVTTSTASSSSSTLSQKIKNNLKNRNLNDVVWLTPGSSVSINSLNCQNEDWAELTEECQIAALTLGYEESTWGQGSTPDTFSVSWEDLTSSQVLAASTFGYTKETWDLLSSETIEPCPLSLTWADLTADCQGASIILGYTEESWNANDEEIFTTGGAANLFWDSLEELQQQSATTFGYTESIWDLKVGILCNDLTWIELPQACRGAASILGFDETSWNDGGLDTKGMSFFSELSEAQQASAELFGYTEGLLDGLRTDTAAPTKAPTTSNFPTTSPSLEPTIAPTPQRCRSSFDALSILFFVIFLPIGVVLTGVPSLIFPCFFPAFIVFMAVWYFAFTTVNDVVATVCPASNFLGIDINNRFFGAE